MYNVVVFLLFDNVVECGGVGDEGCNEESCKCGTSCQCKSIKQSGGKPANCKSANPVDCSDGSCKLTASAADPTNVGLVTDGKCHGPALLEGPQVKKENREQCPLSGTCDGGKDTSLVLFDPNKDSPKGSPRSGNFSLFLCTP